MLVLRSQTIEDYDAKTAAEIMVIDCMMISYYHQLRINGWINNLSTRLEHEFFGKESLTATFKDEYGAEADKIRGLTVEELVRQLGDKLQTQFTGANRTFLRNLKALQELRERPRPSVHIERVGQMNVADTQANAVMGGAEAERPEITAPPRPRSNRRAAADHGAQPREEQARAPRRRSARPRATRELQAAPSSARRNTKFGHDERKP